MKYWKHCWFGHKWIITEIWDHEGGFSHYDYRCSRCSAHEERWRDRETGEQRRAPKIRKSELDIWS